MIGRISGLHGGHLEKETVRLIQAFIVSRVVYVAPHLKLRKSDNGNFDAMIQAAVKKALRLPTKVPTERLLQLGFRNTAEQLTEAQRTSQTARLSVTSAGRYVLRDLKLALLSTTARRMDITEA